MPPLGPAAFGAVCGSVVASVSTMPRWLPEMRKYNYDAGFAAGVTSVGSTLGVVIPPSTALVLYGVLTEESIGQILIGGFIPGLFTMVLLMITVYLVLLWKPELAPAVTKGEKIPFPGKATICMGCSRHFIVCFGGIYGGFFTPTEAGAVGASHRSFAAAIGRLKWSSL